MCTQDGCNHMFGDDRSEVILNGTEILPHVEGLALAEFYHRLCEGQKVSKLVSAVSLPVFEGKRKDGSILGEHARAGVVQSTYCRQQV